MFSLFKSHSDAPHTIAHLNRAVESISRFWFIVCCFSYSGNVTMSCIFITKTSLIIYNTYTEISEAWQNYGIRSLRCRDPSPLQPCYPIFFTGIIPQIMDAQGSYVC